MPPKNAISSAAFLIGPSGKITTWNSACQDILGYAEKQVLLRSIASLLVQPTRKDCQERLKNARNVADKMEAKIIHADGWHHGEDDDWDRP